jgi:hypothetical protein
MMNLALTRTPGDRKLYALADVGTLRLQGMLGRRALARTDEHTWRILRRGFRRRLQAVELSGELFGSFAPGMTGGALTWRGRRYALRPSGVWRQRYALADRDEELAFFEVKSWGRRPVSVAVDERLDLEPGLLLFATFVARAVAEETSGSAATASTAAG